MKPATKRSLVIFAICAACTLILLTFHERNLSPVRNMESFTEDWRARTGRKTPVDKRLVLVGADKPVYPPSDFSEEQFDREPALRLLLNQFPWSRGVWARLIEQLANAGAKVIVLDFVFAAPGDKEGDEALRRVLEQFKDRVVIGYAINDIKTDRGVFLKELVLPNPDLIAYPEQGSILEDDRLGFVRISADWDDILRKAEYRLTGEQAEDVAPREMVLESLNARALRKAGFGEFVPPDFESRRFRYTAPPTEGYRAQSIGDVLSPRVWERNYGNGEFFRDKIVLIGPTAELFHDVHPTPFVKPQRQMPGPEIHLNLMNAALHREFLRETSARANVLTIVFSGLVAFVLCFLVRQPVARLAVVFAVSAAYCALAMFFFNQQNGLVILVAAPVLVLFLSSVIILSYEFVIEQLEKARVRKTLERYVSRDVVKELLDNPATFFNSLGGIRRHVTILFSDVRGFTTLTEKADSAALVKQLNEYFQEMVGHVFGHQGSLDKFIGDAVMAVWGNIVSQGPEKDALNAVATALAMKKGLQKLNEDWKKRGMLELAFGIGINYGEVIVGEMGSSEKVEFTAIGDPVNLASRLEGLTKEYHLDLLLGESMALLVGDTYILRTVDSVQVKGKTKPVDVFAVIGDGTAQTVSAPPWLARYEEGVRLYRKRSFQEAAAAFDECVRQQPDDYLNSMYLKRCQALIENPPDENWDGVFVMTKK